MTTKLLVLVSCAAIFVVAGSSQAGVFDDWLFVDDFESYPTGSIGQNWNADAVLPWFSIAADTYNTFITTRGGFGKVMETHDSYGAYGIGGWMDLTLEDEAGNLYRPDATAAIQQDRFQITFDLMVRWAVEGPYYYGLYRENRGRPTYGANWQSMNVRVIVEPHEGNFRLGYDNPDTIIPGEGEEEDTIIPGETTWAGTVIPGGDEENPREWWVRVVMDIDQVNKLVDVYLAVPAEEPTGPADITSPSDMLANPGTYRFVAGADYSLDTDERFGSLGFCGWDTGGTSGRYRAYLDNIYVDPGPYCPNRPVTDVAGPYGTGLGHRDCQVDINDFAALAADWLKSGLYPPF